MAPRELRRLAASMGTERRLVAFEEYRATTDPDVRERLETEMVRGHERFCFKLARSYANRGVELDDLYAEALRAFAVDFLRRVDRGLRAEVRENNSWFNYAERVIRREIERYVSYQGGTVATPRSERVEAGVSLSYMPEQALEKVAGDVEDDPADALDQRMDAVLLAQHVDALPERQATVVRLRFGLGDCAEHELAEIGAVLSLSKQRVLVILNQALAALRERLAAPIAFPAATPGIGTVVLPKAVAA